MRVVLDTNVYVSFLLTRGATISHILDAWEEDTFTLLISPQMLVEIRRVIEYPHLKARIKPHEAKALKPIILSAATRICSRSSNMRIYRLCRRPSLCESWVRWGIEAG